MVGRDEPEVVLGGDAPAAVAVCRGAGGEEEDDEAHRRRAGGDLVKRARTLDVRYSCVSCAHSMITQAAIFELRRLWRSTLVL